MAPFWPAATAAPLARPQPGRDASGGRRREQLADLLGCAPRASWCSPRAGPGPTLRGHRQDPPPGRTASCAPRSSTRRCCHGDRSGRIDRGGAPRRTDRPRRARRRAVVAGKVGLVSVAAANNEIEGTLNDLAEVAAVVAERAEEPCAHRRRAGRGVARPAPGGDAGRAGVGVGAQSSGGPRASVRSWSGRARRCGRWDPAGTGARTSVRHHPRRRDRRHNRRPLGARPRA